MRLGARVLYVAILLIGAGAQVGTSGPRVQGAAGQTGGMSITPGMREKIDNAVVKALADFGVPSASVAIVLNGEISYAHAYGDARLEPRTAARPEMRYSIGSISKQFTSAAILMLAEQGKLSLDDAVQKYVPGLTRGGEVTIRQLLSHTSGYQDYWPQDYVPPFMSKPVTAQGIMDIWARKPLDFDPGTKWQYSNTNYVIAGVIVEKVSGMPLLQFLQERVFAPLGMDRVQNIDLQKLGDTDATGYMRYALGPPRVAPKEGPGWLFAAGELAMPAEQLARWDIGMLEQKLLKPETYKEMETEVRLKDGGRTGYALGLQTGNIAGHRAFRHGGEVSGFTAQNAVFPDDRAAVVVLTNQDSNGAAGAIARAIAGLVLTPANPVAAARMNLARRVFMDLQQGKIDRTLFTDNANSYFTAEALRDFAASLGPLGEPQGFTAAGEQGRGGMTFRGYSVTFARKTLEISIYEMPDGKIEQFLVSAAN
jgi:CubicO group peptidase (beta-lactamase class C family)